MFLPVMAIGNQIPCIGVKYQLDRLGVTVAFHAAAVDVIEINNNVVYDRIPDFAELVVLIDLAASALEIDLDPVVRHVAFENGTDFFE